MLDYELEKKRDYELEKLKLAEKYEFMGDGIRTAVRWAIKEIERLQNGVRELGLHHSHNPLVRELQKRVEELEAEISCGKAFAYNIYPERTENDLKATLDEQIQVLCDWIEGNRWEVDDE